MTIRMTNFFLMVTVLKIEERAMNLDHSYIAGGNIKGNSQSKKHFGSFFKKKNHITII